MTSDAFDEVLSLEEQFYDEGYRQGTADGIKAGRIEGRTFGLEKGFEKYMESGRLYGKSLVWASRIATSASNSTAKPAVGLAPVTQSSHLQDDSAAASLPSLQLNARLSKNIRTLHALAESESLSIDNTEEAVSDFDDRFKRANAKARMIERVVGESKEVVDGQGKSSGEGSIEDISVLYARH